MKRREFITLLGGAAVAWPLTARAQQPASVRRIAVVHPVFMPQDMNERVDGRSPFYHGFFTELQKLGYIESKNFIVERRSGDGRPERYAEVARELAQLKPDVIIVNGARMLEYLRAATTTIPIIAITGDPILFGIVSNLARPGGNVTGFSADASIEIHGKYLEILKEIKPSLSRVGLLTPRLSWEPYSRPLREIANRMGLAILGPPVNYPVGEPEYRRVFAAMVREGADALLVTQASENIGNSRVIIELAEKNRLVAIYPAPEWVKRGGLIAYAVDLVDIGARAAGYVHKILQGDKVGELPFYMPTKMQLIINRKTAKAFGLEIPPMLEMRADEVTE